MIDSRRLCRHGGSPTPMAVESTARGPVASRRHLPQRFLARRHLLLVERVGEAVADGALGVPALAGALLAGGGGYPGQSISDVGRRGLPIPWCREGGNPRTRDRRLGNLDLLLAGLPSLTVASLGRRLRMRFLVLGLVTTRPGLRLTSGLLARFLGWPVVLRLLPVPAEGVGDALVLRRHVPHLAG